MLVRTEPAVGSRIAENLHTNVQRSPETVPQVLAAVQGKELVWFFCYFL